MIRLRPGSILKNLSMQEWEAGVKRSSQDRMTCGKVSRHERRSCNLAISIVIEYNSEKCAK